MKVSEEAKDAIMAVLQESDGQPIYFRDLMRLGREKSIQVSYNLRIHSEVIEQLKEDGFVLRNRGKRGIQVRLGSFPYKQKGPVGAI